MLEVTLFLWPDQTQPLLSLSPLPFLFPLSSFLQPRPEACPVPCTDRPPPWNAGLSLHNQVVSREIVGTGEEDTGRS